MPTVVYNLSQRPELRPLVLWLEEEGWPHFMLYRTSLARCRDVLFGELGSWQLLLYDDDIGELYGTVYTVPLHWDGNDSGLPAGWDAAIEQAVRERSEQEPPNTLCALSVTVAPSRQGAGLSTTLLESAKACARDAGFNELIVPVRPTMKSRYPLTPMERYAQWKRADGSPFDPWLRTHWKLGGLLLGAAPASRVIQATIHEWEQWTGMIFPDSGPYVVPGALQPIEIDVETNCGVYEEPNIWVRHPLMT